MLTMFSLFVAICKRCREHLQEVIKTTSVEPSSGSATLEESPYLELPSSFKTQQHEENPDSSEQESAKVRVEYILGYPRVTLKLL